MTNQIFLDLREKMDQYSVGLPSTDSGVELRLLERLFTEEEAVLHCNIGMTPETSAQIARRMGRDEGEVAAALERMANKGLLFSRKAPDAVTYKAIPFVVGVYEHQINTMDREFAEEFDQYLMGTLGPQGLAQFAPLRTIPVNRSIHHAWEVASYENIRSIVEGKDRIAVGNCVCRVQRGLLDKACGKPVETCFKFDVHADYYVEKGFARRIGLDEAMSVLGACEAAGMVAMPGVAQEVGTLCNCCGDCCAVLRVIKLHPRPVEKIITGRYAVVEPDACSACGTCVDRCQMDAIRLPEDADAAEVDLDRCIGCGLCVTTCPGEAIALKAKPERREPPVKIEEYYALMAAARGKSLSPAHR